MTTDMPAIADVLHGVCGDGAGMSDVQPSLSGKTAVGDNGSGDGLLDRFFSGRSG